MHNFFYQTFKHREIIIPEEEGIPVNFDLSTINIYLLCEPYGNPRVMINNIGHLIVDGYISIGLDNSKHLIYSRDMNLFEVSVQAKLVQDQRTKKDNRIFVRFVKDQFKELSRKNLGLPMKLYHL